MRKMIAGFMAAAMVTSVCATASLAMGNTSAKNDMYISGDLQADAFTAVILAVTVEDVDTGKIIYYTQPFQASYVPTGGNIVGNDVAKSLDGVVINDIEIDQKRYSVELKQDPSDPIRIWGTVLPAAKISDTGVEIKILDADGKKLMDDQSNELFLSFTYQEVGNTAGSGGTLADVEAQGDLANIDISEVIECDGQGNPVPLTESGIGVDKSLNDQQGVQSNKTLYFLVKKGSYDFNNDSYWKIKVGKGNNAKLIKSVSDTSKNFSGNLYNAVRGGEVSGTSGRQRVIKVELNELLTDDEFKVALDMTLTAKAAAERVFGVKPESQMKVKDFAFYVKNLVKSADNDWRVGINGLMLNPLQNDWNNVTYFDEDGDVASLRFFGDSDVGKFYAKLSTKWTHTDYAAYFNNQDAFVFEFTGSPKLSSTSRADLQIYDPFTDIDGNSTFDAASATVYQVVDGDLIDVTDSFTYGEGDNGENAFITRTRFVGTYIICEKPVEESAGKGDVDDLVPDGTDGANSTDSATGGKNPANTGRYA